MRFGLVAAGAYLLLVLAWTAVGARLRPVARSAIQTAWSGLFPEHAVRCLESPPDLSAADSIVLLWPADASRPVGGFALGVFQTAVQPWAVFLALAVARKGRASRKGSGIAFGTLLTALFVSLRIGIAIVMQYHAMNTMQAGATTMGRLWKTAYVLLYAEPSANYIYGLLLFAVIPWASPKREAKFPVEPEVDR